jgi:hypothetical protein
VHGTYLSSGVIWSTWAVAGTGVLLATAGWEAAGLTIWLVAVTVQIVLGSSVLVRRRRALSK